MTRKSLIPPPRWPSWIVGLALVAAQAACGGQHLESADTWAAPTMDGATSENGGNPDGGGDGIDGADTQSDLPPQRPFGNHSQTYVAGSILPAGAQSVLDDAVKVKYQSWKRSYLRKGCGGYYVMTDLGIDDAVVTISYAHGYGMLISALMAGVDPDARAIFDGFVAIRKHLPSASDPSLMSWGMNRKCVLPPLQQNDSITDGDLDAAFALLLADKQWGGGGYVNYAQEARNVIEAVKAKEMNPVTDLPLLGDWLAPTDPHYMTTRFSDHMPDHFRSFTKATGDTFWTEAVASAYRTIALIQTNYSPTTGLLPDFARNTDTNPNPVPVSIANSPGPDGLDQNQSRDFDYGSCRVPWRLGTDYLVTGDPMVKDVLAKFNTFIQKQTNNVPSMILDGYSLDGTPSPDAQPNGCFTGSFGVSALIDSSNQAWADAIWNQLVGGPQDASFYGDTIRLLTMIVMSGNWWAP